jgi:hypothetical protein
MSLKQILIAVDQLGNTLLGGWADETISARSWRLQHKRHWAYARALIDKIFFWEPGHCEKAHQSELERRHVHPSMRSYTP